MYRAPLVAGLIALVASLTLGAKCQEPSADASTEQHFRDRVAPVLAQRCVQCHNPKKSRGSLDLTTRATALEGGEHGPALAPGDAKKSLLYQMIAGAKPRMPKQQAPLGDRVVADIARWI